MSAAVRGFEEAGALLAVLGVDLQFVFEVGGCAGGVAAVELEGAVAVLAAELGVAIEEGVDEGFELPEGLVPGAGGAYAAAFYFALVELLWSCKDFGGHGAFLGAGVAGKRCLDSTLLRRAGGEPSRFFGVRSAAD